MSSRPARPRRYCGAACACDLGLGNSGASSFDVVYSVIFCRDSLFITVFSTMNDLQEQLQKLLPTDVKYLITDISSCADGGFKCTIQLQCSTSDECDQWVTEFSRVTLCTWRVRNTYPNGRRGLLYRKDYVCQHSAFNKDHPKRRKTKDTGCGAKFCIKVCTTYFYMPTYSNSII